MAIRHHNSAIRSTEQVKRLYINIVIAVNSLEKGGRTKRILQEKYGLERLGHHVTLICFQSPPEWVEQIYIDYCEWNCLAKADMGFDLNLLQKLLRLLGKLNTDVVHTHCEASMFYLGLACLFSRAKIVGTYHRSELAHYRPTMKNKFYAMLLDHCVAISNERMSRMTEQLGINTKKITLIHGGVDSSELPELVEQNTLKEKLQCSGAVIFSAGHLGSIKGHDDSIEAFGRIKGQLPDVKLYIAGDGAQSDYQRLEAKIEDAGLHNRVILLGQVVNSMEWMLACDLFLQPSREEGFGLVFIEAGLCGKPTVATNVGGIPDIVIHGKTGLLVEPFDIEALSSSILELLNCKHRLNAFGLAAQQRVQNNFDLDAKIVKLVSVYDSL